MLVLSDVFLMFLNIKIWNKIYTFKNKSFYLFCMFEENPPVLQSSFEGSFLFYFLV